MKTRLLEAAAIGFAIAIGAYLSPTWFAKPSSFHDDALWVSAQVPYICNLSVILAVVGLVWPPQKKSQG